MIASFAFSQPPVLFAAGIDWLEALLPVLFVGFWILSQVFAVLRRVGGGPARPPVVRGPDIARDDTPTPRPPQVDPRAELNEQIADFLRQVTGEAPVARPARTPAQPPPLRPEPTPRPRVDKPKLPKRSTSAASRPQPVSPPASPPGERSEAVGERHVGTLDMRPSAVARHVQDAFAHDLGRLHSGLERPGDESSAAGTPQRGPVGRTIARELVVAARDPATMRQAILLREILERPVDRW